MTESDGRKNNMMTRGRLQGMCKGMIGRRGARKKEVMGKGDDGK
jgi:hypothetical protein